MSDEDEAMRQTLGYVELSPYGAEKDCRNCEFWIPQEAGAACGGCTLFAGTVDPLAYCDAWALAANYVPPAEAPPAEAPPAEAPPAEDAPPAVDAQPAPAAP